MSANLSPSKLQDIYGADAEKVALRKREQKLVVSDKNDSRIELFLHFSEEVEAENASIRTSSVSASADLTAAELRGKKHQLNPVAANLVHPSLPTPTLANAPPPQGQPQGQPPGQEPLPQPKKKGKKVVNLEVCSPLEKAHDLLGKILKSKTQASDLSLQLRSVPYAEELQKKMTGFAAEFESLYLQVHELVSKEVNVPEPYLKPVQAFVQLQQTYESPLKAATALSKNVGPKKRQAKAKPGAEAKRQKS
ncbi:unnamed protein product [Effrenium voratum]|nr:unnamed protein product [Effrenium voratum]